MIRSILCMLIFVMFSSCSPMKRQKPTINPVDLRADCINVFNLLSKHWYKHKSKECHEVSFHYWNFCFNNKECLKHLSKGQVIKLFGQPDIVLDDINIEYIIKKVVKKNLCYITINFVLLFKKAVIL